mmetsp:Transcript_18129/g.27899  ORF Transcript_18129/g.27899 Transcript_18129/m.27899 type:complete len:81 (-) Transcript_18129:299-541(-)
MENIKILKDPSFMKLLPLIFFRGTLIAVNSSMYVPLWVSLINDTTGYEDLTEDEKNERAAFTYNTLGIGSFVGGMMLGYI